MGSVHCQQLPMNAEGEKGTEQRLKSRQRNGTSAGNCNPEREQDSPKAQRQPAAADWCCTVVTAKLLPCLRFRIGNQWLIPGGLPPAVCAPVAAL